MRKLWFSGGNVLAVLGQVWTPRLSDEGIVKICGITDLRATLSWC